MVWLLPLGAASMHLPALAVSGLLPVLPFVLMWFESFIWLSSLSLGMS